MAQTQEKLKGKKRYYSFVPLPQTSLSCTRAERATGTWCGGEARGLRRGQGPPSQGPTCGQGRLSCSLRLLTLPSPLETRPLPAAALHPPPALHPRKCRWPVLCPSGRCQEAGGIQGWPSACPHPCTRAHTQVFAQHTHARGAHADTHRYACTHPCAQHRQAFQALRTEGDATRPLPRHPRLPSDPLHVRAKGHGLPLNFKSKSELLTDVLPNSPGPGGWGPATCGLPAPQQPDQGAEGTPTWRASTEPRRPPQGGFCTPSSGRRGRVLGKVSLAGLHCWPKAGAIPRCTSGRRHCDRPGCGGGGPSGVSRGPRPTPSPAGEALAPQAPCPPPLALELSLRPGPRREMTPGPGAVGGAAGFGPQVAPG